MNDKNVFFKIKTTAPKKYCVRPNCGSVPPNGTMKVMIALQPFDYDPNEKNKHKFMVQSLIQPDDNVEIEQAFYDAAADQVTEMKLRCVFEMPQEEAGNNSGPVQLAKDLSAILSSSPGKKNGAGGTGDDVVSTTGAAGNTTASSEQFRTTAEVGGSSPRGGDALQEDIEQLRQENFLLNEQILRLKMTIESAQTGRDSAVGSKSFQNNSYAPPPSSVMQLQQQQKTVFIVAGVMLALLGILIGKFVL